MAEMLFDHAVSDVSGSSPRVSGVEGTKSDTIGAPASPVFLWSLISYGFTSTLTLLSVFVFAVVVGLGIEGVIAGRGFAEGLVGRERVMATPLFTAFLWLGCLACFVAGSALIWRLAPRAKPVYALVSFVSTGGALFYLAENWISK